MAGLSPAGIVAATPAGGQGEERAKTIRVLLVDDDALVVSGLTMMLNFFPDIEVVGSADDGAGVPGAVDRFRPDVVLMDIRMPRVDGLTATASLRARRDPPEVIVLTTFDEDAHVKRAMQVGASGFLLKHTPPAEIVAAIRRVAAGDPMLSPTVLRQVMNFVAEADAAPGQVRARAALARLSPGELAAARLIRSGHTNQEIAAHMNISTATVKAYVTRIFTKLSVNNRVHIANVVRDAE